MAKTSIKIVVELLSGALLAVASLCALLLLLSMNGWLVFTWPQESYLITVWNWIYVNLQESIFVFFLTFVLWLKTCFTLNKELSAESPKLDKVTFLEHMLDIQAGVFFGIGVIFTAIGMRSALVMSLGGIDAEQAAQQGAFVMLQRLVDGGILLALSTTIVGGVGGYLMRILKSLIFGKRLQSFVQKVMSSEQQSFNQQIDEIKQHLALISAHYSVSKRQGEGAQDSASKHREAS